MKPIFTCFFVLNFINSIDTKSDFSDNDNNSRSTELSQGGDFDFSSDGNGDEEHTTEAASNIMQDEEDALKMKERLDSSVANCSIKKPRL